MLRTWSEALDCIYGFANWETRPPGTRPRFELDRIRAVLEALGNPQQTWPAVHVGGTNGKGSTAAMIASASSAAGYRTGLYTSPHLHSLRERIQLDGQPIAEDWVLDWLNRHRIFLAKHHGLTTFEVLTALAFDYFRAQKVDLAVVEVGLGGRLDATRMVCPSVVVLTPIDLDHTEVLGSTVAAIAAEKCGIVVRERPVVCAPQLEEAQRVIEACCAEQAAPLVRLGREVMWRATASSVAGQELLVTCHFPSGRARRYRVAIPLLGQYQQVNAAAAVAALDVLRCAGWRFSPRSVHRGLASVRWPARCEVMSHNPLLIVDGAHNPHGAQALATALLELWGPTPWQLVLGASQGKDLQGMLTVLLPHAAAVVATQAEHPRALPATLVAEAVVQRGRSALVAASPAQALDLALAGAAPGQPIVATGSLFVAADIRLAWLRRTGQPLPPVDPPDVAS